MTSYGFLPSADNSLPIPRRSCSFRSASSVVMRSGNRLRVLLTVDIRLAGMRSVSLSLYAASRLSMSCCKAGRLYVETSLGVVEVVASVVLGIQGKSEAGRVNEGEW